MKISEDDIMQIQQYLDYQMNDEERKAFEERLEQEAELQKALVIYQNIPNVSQDYFENQRREDIAKAYQEVKQEQPIQLSEEGKKRSLFSYWRSIAATLLILIIAILGWSYWNLKQQNNKVLVENYIKDSNQRSSEDTTSPLKKKIDDGILTLKNKQYNQAKTLFDDALLVSQKDNNPIQYKIQWYLALCHIGLGEIPAAQNILSNLIEENQPSPIIVQQAKELQSTLLWKERLGIKR